MSRFIEQIVETLALYRSKELDGYFITKLEINNRKYSLNDALHFYAKMGFSFCEITHVMNASCALKLTLAKGNTRIQNQKETRFQYAKPVLNKVFTDAELNEFLNRSGDDNSIHLLEPKVVPGLLILDFLEKNQKLQSQQFTIKFTQPLYLNHELNVWQVSDNQYIGSTDETAVFDIKFH